MTLAIAEAIVAVIEAYAGAGVIFALLFLPRVVARLDPGLAAAPRTLRVLIMPGVVALWPLFAWRWLAHAPAPIERNAHRAGARNPVPRSAAPDVTETVG